MHSVIVTSNRTGQVVYCKDHKCAQKACKDFSYHFYKLNKHGYTVSLQTVKSGIVEFCQ